MVDNQELLRDFLDENKISIYDIVNCGYWRQRGFLEKLFGNIGVGYYTHEFNDLSEYFKNNSWKFRELEETVTQNKYVIISKSDKDFHSTGFKSMIYLKTWISELSSLVPICLIIDGVLSKKKFSKIIKYDIEESVEE